MMKIILIDDDYIFADYLNEFMEDFELLYFPTVNDALKFEGDSEVVFILLDLMFPISKSEEIAKKLDFIPGIKLLDHLVKVQPSTPIAILSGALRWINAQNDILRYIEKFEQVKYILKKPMALEDLENLIRDHFKSK